MEVLYNVHVSKPMNILGLLMQPLIGALSDRNTSRFGRRRPYIAVGSILVCASLLGVAYAREIAAGIANVLETNSEDTLHYAVRPLCNMFIVYDIEIC